VPRGQNAHYVYELPFVVRWLAHRDPPQDAVFYFHGGGSLISGIGGEKRLGAANPFRVSDLQGDDLTGAGALLNGMAFISLNRGGLKNDGTLSATYLTSEVAALTESEVTAIYSSLPPAGSRTSSSPGSRRAIPSRP
jgi:hypothetical protein